MNPVEALVAVVSILCCAIIVALATNSEVRTQIKSKLFVFVLWTKRGIGPLPGKRAGSKRAMRTVQDKQAWLSRSWLKALILAFTRAITDASLSLWCSQAPALRKPVSDRLREALNLLGQNSGEPLEINTRRETLDQLLRAMKLRARNLENNPYHQEEIWIVDHHWRFWLTDSFSDYLCANNEFVLRGGKIHRMFILSKNDFDDRKLNKMLCAQCGIGTNSATDIVSSDFELWLAGPDIKSWQPYKEISKQFTQLTGAADEFEKFDALQFNDAFYFSNSFNVREEFLGRSTWIFDPAQIAKIHLDILFGADNGVAFKFNCDRFQESFKEARSRIARPVPRTTSKTGNGLVACRVES